MVDIEDYPIYPRSVEYWEVDEPFTLLGIVKDENGNFLKNIPVEFYNGDKLLSVQRTSEKTLVSTVYQNEWQPFNIYASLPYDLKIGLYDFKTKIQESANYNMAEDNDYVRVNVQWVLWDGHYDDNDFSYPVPLKGNGTCSFRWDDTNDYYVLTNNKKNSESIIFINKLNGFESKYFKFETEVEFDGNCIGFMIYYNSNNYYSIRFSGGYTATINNRVNGIDQNTTVPLEGTYEEGYYSYEAFVDNVNNKLIVELYDDEWVVKDLITTDIPPLTETTRYGLVSTGNAGAITKLHFFRIMPVDLSFFVGDYENEPIIRLEFEESEVIATNEGFTLNASLTMNNVPVDGEYVSCDCQDMRLGTYSDKNGMLKFICEDGYNTGGTYTISYNNVTSTCTVIPYNPNLSENEFYWFDKNNWNKYNFYTLKFYPSKEKIWINTTCWLKEEFTRSDNYDLYFTIEMPYNRERWLTFFKDTSATDTNTGYLFGQDGYRITSISGNNMTNIVLGENYLTVDEKHDIRISRNGNIASLWFDGELVFENFNVTGLKNTIGIKRSGSNYPVTIADFRLIEH